MCVASVVLALVICLPTHSGHTHCSSSSCCCWIQNTLLLIRINFLVESVIKSLMSCICYLHIICVGPACKTLAVMQGGSFLKKYNIMKSKQGLSLFFNICLSDVLKHRILYMHIYIPKYYQFFDLSVLSERCRIIESVKNKTE